jgi:hypothetical protein
MTQQENKESWEELKRELGTDENVKIIVGPEAEKISEKLDKTSNIKLPPKPSGILEWEESDLKSYKFAELKLPDFDNCDKIKKQLQFKLFNIWSLWGSYRQNEGLIKSLNTVPEDKTSDEFNIKCALVLIIDKLGKILESDTNILEELSS